MIDDQVIIGSGGRPSGRGVNVVAFNRNKQILIATTFDTHFSADASQNFAKTIAVLPLGTYVIVAVRDAATQKFSGSAQRPSMLPALGQGSAGNRTPFPTCASVSGGCNQVRRLSWSPVNPQFIFRNGTRWHNDSACYLGCVKNRPIIGRAGQWGS